MIDMLLKNSSRGDLGVHEGRLGADVVGAIPHGHDSVMDPWYRLGSGDPLQAAFVLAHLGHMSGDAERRTLMDMITVAPAAALGVADDGLHLAGSADLVVFEARSEAEALRLQRPRHLVLRAGRVLAGTQPARSFVNWHGVSEEIDFRPR
jgi:cytosine/creatinine deaminase